VLNHAKLLAVKALFTKTATAREGTLEPMDKLRFAALQTLDMIRSELEQWEKAEIVFNRLIAKSDKAFGPDSGPAAGAVSNLGNVYVQLESKPRSWLPFQRIRCGWGRSLGRNARSILKLQWVDISLSVR
jgi:hypothetical protein